jgi:cytochrome c oxidase subunit 2
MTVLKIMKQFSLPKPVKLALWAVIALCAGAFAHPALADGLGMAHDWQLGFQDAASPVAERMHWFHHILLYIISGICALVFMLLLIVIVRFNAKANPVPSTRTHNVVLEVIWTVVPVVILVIIAVPSMSLLYYGDRTAKPDMTLKVTGYQWYWGYEYPSFDGLSYLSNYIHEKDIDKSKGQEYLLSVDNPLVLPVDTNVQIIVTAQDVIHDFSVPSFGVKIDAIPGRLNETWVRITKPGSYYGQCDQLCGQNHAFMPIEVRAVPKDEFKAWAVAAAKNYVSYDQFEAGRPHAAETAQ